MTIRIHHKQLSSDSYDHTNWCNKNVKYVGLSVSKLGYSYLELLSVGERKEERLQIPLYYN